MSYDMTMCPGQNCPIKQNCSRFTDEILGRQDFFAEAPYNFITNYCLNCCEFQRRGYKFYSTYYP